MECTNCKKINVRGQCPYCDALYCSTACQEQHWPDHKKACYTLAAEKLVLIQRKRKRPLEEEDVGFLTNSNTPDEVIIAMLLKVPDVTDIMTLGSVNKRLFNIIGCTDAYLYSLSFVERRMLRGLVAQCEPQISRGLWAKLFERDFVKLKDFEFIMTDDLITGERIRDIRGTYLEQIRRVRNKIEIFGDEGRAFKTLDSEIIVFFELVARSLLDGKELLGDFTVLTVNSVSVEGDSYRFHGSNDFSPPTATAFSNHKITGGEITFLSGTNIYGFEDDSKEEDRETLFEGRLGNISAMVSVLISKSVLVFKYGPPFLFGFNGYHFQDRYIQYERVILEQEPIIPTQMVGVQNRGAKVEFFLRADRVRISVLNIFTGEEVEATTLRSILPDSPETVTFDGLLNLSAQLVEQGIMEVSIETLFDAGDAIQTIFDGFVTQQLTILTRFILPLVATPQSRETLAIASFIIETVPAFGMEIQFPEFFSAGFPPKFVGAMAPENRQVLDGFTAEEKLGFGETFFNTVFNANRDALNERFKRGADFRMRVEVDVERATKYFATLKT